MVVLLMHAVLIGSGLTSIIIVYFLYALHDWFTHRSNPTFFCEICKLEL